MAGSLYDRLGGLPAIEAVVEALAGRAAGDTRINQKFARTDIARLKRMVVDQVCEATGGPCTYSGRSMEQTHQGMGVTAGEFEAFVEDLVTTLNQFNVGKAEQDELLSKLGGFRSEIVESESAQTGTPLPASYQPAPAMA